MTCREKDVSVEWLSGCYPRGLGILFRTDCSFCTELAIQGSSSKEWLLLELCVSCLQVEVVMLGNVHNARRDVKM